MPKGKKNPNSISPKRALRESRAALVEAGVEGEPIERIDMALAALATNTEKLNGAIIADSTLADRAVALIQDIGAALVASGTPLKKARGAIKFDVTSADPFVVALVVGDDDDDDDASA